MASKIVVMKSGNFEAETTAERLNVELEALRQQLIDHTGVTTAEDGTEFPTQSFDVHPDIKAGIKAKVAFLVGVFMADKRISSGGREPKADLAALQKVYVDYMRSNPGADKGVAAMDVAVQYNQGRDVKIDQTYVQRQIKRYGWDALVNVPEPAAS